MKLSELKKLTNNELAIRFPFLVVREWNGKLAKDDDDSYLIEINGMNGWRDILLCWAEKVKPIFDNLDKEAQKNFYIMECKEKWGGLRLDTSSVPTERIDEFITMAEHLSQYTCLYCGKITKSSNGKKLISFRNGLPLCKKCSYQRVLDDWHHFGPDCYLDWIAKSKKPIKTIRRFNLKDRHEGDWFARIRRWKPDGTTEYIKYDCRELLEGVYD